MNFNVIDQAIKSVRDKFKIDFAVNQHTIQTDPEDAAIGAWIAYRREPELKMPLTAMEDHDSQTKHTDLDCAIFGSDAEDGSKADEAIGGNTKGCDLDMRQALRLAFIIYNGMQYGVKREQRKDYIGKGWHPRAASVRMRY